MIAAGAAGGDPRRRIFIVTAPGLEPVAARELAALGLEAQMEPGGVLLEGGRRELYAANFHLRTASRVLVRIAEFRARTFFELERHAAKVPWSDFVGGGRSVRLRVTSRKSRLYHQRAIEQRLREAIGAPLSEAPADEETEGEREQLFVVRFLHDRCVVSADSSGALLHRRGYRQAVARAPLRETLAAAMLLGTGWDGTAPLLDPLCGSGTIPIEAALIARRIAPGIANADREPRSYAFMAWNDFDGEAFRKLVDAAREEIVPAAAERLVASDRDAGAVVASIANARRAGVAENLEVTERPVSEAEVVGAGGWVVTNPPYGVRVGQTSGLRDLYAALGNLACRAVPGGRVVLLSADRALEAQMRTPLREVISTRNGGIPVRVVAGTVQPGKGE